MSDPILSVHNLVGGYGKMTILNGTTFSVPQASITTIIGPNGAGKSTVFKAIFGLLKLRELRRVGAGRVLQRGDVLAEGRGSLVEGAADFGVVAPGVQHAHGL